MIPTIYTSFACQLRERIVMRGYDPLLDLPDDDFWSLASLSVGGPRLSPQDARILDALNAISGIGDPRIWPMRIARIIAAYGKEFEALAGATLCLQDAKLGPWSVGEACLFLLEIEKHLDDGKSLEVAVEVASREGRSGGYGVPGRIVDERTEAFTQWYAQNVGIQRPWWELSLAIRPIMNRLHGLPTNIGGCIAPVLMDMGITQPNQIRVISLLLLYWPLVGNAVEGTRESPEIFRSLPEELCAFEGQAPRVSPRALRTSKGTTGVRE